MKTIKYHGIEIDVYPVTEGVVSVWAMGQPFKRVDDAMTAIDAMYDLMDAAEGREGEAE